MLKAFTTCGSVAISVKVFLIRSNAFLIRSNPSERKAALKPALNKVNKPFNLSPNPSKIDLKLLFISSRPISGRISLKAPLPLFLPFLPFLPFGLLGLESSESSFFFKALISSNPARPNNSLTAFLADSAVSSKLSDKPPEASSASPRASATSPAPPAKFFMPLFALPIAPSFTVAFLLNIKPTNSASLAVTFFNAIASEFKTGIIAFKIGRNELPIFKAASFNNDLNRLTRPFTVDAKVSPYFWVACSKIAISRICCCVKKSN